MVRHAHIARCSGVSEDSPGFAQLERKAFYFLAAKGDLRLGSSASIWLGYQCMGQTRPSVSPRPGPSTAPRA